MQQPLRVIIADDEPLARDSLRVLLAEDPTVSIVDECGDGAATVEAIRRERPDLVFLDIQMPGGDGFDVLRRLEPACRPVVVFVTAYDRYALRAFDENALDYLLKPFSDERFRRTLARARERCGTRQLESYAHQLAGLLGDAAPARLVIRGTGSVRFVETVAIRWIGGAGNYVEIHTADGTALHRETLRALERQLDPERFARTHRSAIVNLRCVTELRTRDHGDGLAILDDGSEVPVSRRYRERLERLLGVA